MEIRISVGIMYSTRRAMYLSHLLLPPPAALSHAYSPVMKYCSGLVGPGCGYRAASYISGTLWKSFFTMP